MRRIAPAITTALANDLGDLVFRTLNRSLLSLSLLCPLALSAACSTATTATDSGAMDSSTPDATRPDAGMCVDPPLGNGRPVAWECSDCRLPGPGASAGGCTTDADCPEGDNGRCVSARGGGICSYDECFEDGDCATGELCACDGGVGGGNACLTAGCTVDADCGAYACSPTLGSCGDYLPAVGYNCHTATDACYSDADCEAGYCAYDTTSGAWACSTSACAG